MSGLTILLDNYSDLKDQDLFHIQLNKIGDGLNNCEHMLIPPGGLIESIEVVFNDQHITAVRISTSDDALEVGNVDTIMPNERKKWYYFSKEKQLIGAFGRIDRQDKISD